MSDLASDAVYTGQDPACVALHKKLEPGSLYDQKTLEKLAGAKDMDALQTILQGCMNSQFIKPMKDDSGKLLFEAIDASVAKISRSLPQEERLIYSHIISAGREGIWTKTIKSKTNLHQQVVTRALKFLETQEYIKQINDVKHRTRKMYMLFHLQPSQDLTGGPWFTDANLDSQFIQSMLDVVWEYVARKSYPDSLDVMSLTADEVENYQNSFPPNYTLYPTVDDIYSFIQKSGVSQVNLIRSDIKTICEVLVFDDRFERRDMGLRYKASWQSVWERMQGNSGRDTQGDLDGFNESPCGGCSALELCLPGGPVNPEACEYFDKWLG